MIICLSYFRVLMSSAHPVKKTALEWPKGHKSFEYVKGKNSQKSRHD